MNIQSILKEEIKQISLSDSEIKNLNSLASEILSKLKKVGIKAQIGGSLAKGTILRKDVQDIDIFAIFEKEEDTKKLESLLRKADLNFQTIHGSRDYFHILKENIIFEIIPVVKFKDPEKAENVTDFSLLHVDYVKRKIAKNKKLADEIKLAKVFCFYHDCYGAESYIQGFSGYALELLVLQFGSFEKFLKAIVKLKKDKLVLDPAKHFKNLKNVMIDLNESKLLSPIVLIDPTYKFRNVTAGLSQETFQKFLKVSSSFLKSPSLKFFEIKKINPEQLEKTAKAKKAALISLQLKTDKQEGDIAATKMKKFFGFIIKELERKQQKILQKEFVYEEGQSSQGFLIIKENEEIEVKGPPKSNKEAIKRFKLVHKKITFKKDIAFAKQKTSLKEIFNHLKRFEYEMAVRFTIL
jgi:tRNA nucleotidyltransferase (CCA-adding enzyme)